MWADTTVVHLLVNGAPHRTVPSRLTTENAVTACLRHLCAPVHYKVIDIVVAGLGRLRDNMRQTDVYERSVTGRWVVWSRATAVGPIPAPQSKS